MIFFISRDQYSQNFGQKSDFLTNEVALWTANETEIKTETTENW